MRLVSHCLKGKQKKYLGEKQHTDKVGRKQSQLESLWQLYRQDLQERHKVLSITGNALYLPERQRLPLRPLAPEEQAPPQSEVLFASQYSLSSFLVSGLRAIPCQEPLFWLRNKNCCPYNPEMSWDKKQEIKGAVANLKKKKNSTDEFFIWEDLIYQGLPWWLRW